MLSFTVEALFDAGGGTSGCPPSWISTIRNGAMSNRLLSGRPSARKILQALPPAGA
ncbi:hypothetical protein [Polyangium sp. 15x6]|uniref:hypothetical protein n=1 Tax=Polyangium sp. 15x6 TaxID=3042687 RepID=UPI00249CC82E|nr:hypothetical protein [Polyangium sp. 15x6]MDI3289902.1 hypothetical protein [Polyangium sp. 15x6]